MSRYLKFSAINKILSFSVVGILFPLLFGIRAQSIKSLRGTNFDIALTATDAVIKIPVTLVPDSGTINPRLVDVSFDNPVRTISPSLFAATIETDSLKNSFLNISIHNQPPLDQGKYHLIFNIRKVKPSTVAEIFTIDLVVKPASIVPITNLVVARVQQFPFFPYTPSYKTLTIFESSRNAIISPVTIRELSLTDVKGTNVPANVIFSYPDQVVPAGKQADFSYELKGDLPVGTVSGNFEINAPQLTAPVQFKMDIITKKGGAWIFLIILAGLLLGYTTRIFLNNILQLNKARKEASELSGLLDKERQSRPDETFANTIDQLQKTLNDTSNSNTVKINEAIASVHTGLAAAIIAFNAAQADLQTKLKTFMNALNGIWFLPAEVETTIATASINLGKVNDFVANNNTGAGEKALQKLNEELGADLITSTEQFKNKLKESFESIRQSPLKIANADAPLLKELNDLATAASVIPEDNFEENPANIRELLKALSTQRRHTANFFFNISLAIKSLMETLANIFSNGNVDLQEELFAITKKSDQKFVLQSDKSLDAALVSVGSDMKEIQNDLLQALISEKLSLTEDQIKVIQTAVIDGHYTDAANSIVGFKRPAIIRESFTDNNKASERSIGPAISFMPAADAGFILNPLAVTTITNNSAGLSAADNRYREIVRTIFWTSLLQTLLIGIGIAVFGYGLFAEKFTGTVADMIEIFSWAFVLDVSINTLTTTAGGIPKKAGA